MGRSLAPRSIAWGGAGVSQGVGIATSLKFWGENTKIWTFRYCPQMVIFGDQQPVCFHRRWASSSSGGRGAPARGPSSPLKQWGTAAPDGYTDAKKHRSARGDPSRVAERNHFTQAERGRISARWRARRGTGPFARQVSSSSTSAGRRLPTRRPATRRDERGHGRRLVGNRSPLYRASHSDQGLGLKSRIQNSAELLSRIFITAPGGIQF